METIEILNWDKYNPRKDIKTSSWLRLQNTFFENHEFYDFTHGELCFWIYLMCLASKKQSGQIIFVRNHAITVGRFTDKIVESSLKKLININCVTIRNVDVTCAVRAVNLPDLTGPDLTGPDLTGPDGATRSSLVEPLIVIPEFKDIESILIERVVNENQQVAILQAFPEPNWVMSEVRKAIAWETGNPSRKKKQFGKFIISWLTRSWDQRKHPATVQSKAQQMSDANMAMAERIVKGKL